MYQEKFVNNLEQAKGEYKMGLKQDVVRNAFTVWYLITLRRTFGGAPKKILNDQNRKIYKLMKRAYKIPVYRAKFDQSGTMPEDYHSAADLVKFPTLTKSELRKWMQTEWDDHPEKHKDTVVLSTSGSTGTPLRMLYTLKEKACSDANWARVLSMAGYKPLTGKMYSFRAGGRETRTHGRDSIIQELGLMRRKLVSESSAVGDGIADMIRDISDYKADLIVLQRNVMVRLVKYAEEHNLELRRPIIYAPVGEIVDPVSRKVLKNAFGDGLIDAYGLTELGSFIYEFPGKKFRYVANDIAVANVYNDKDELADDGRIVVTSLYKTTYPIINYETGDLGKSFIKDGVRYFTDITGRMNDLVRHEDGTDTSASELMIIAYHTTGLSQFRFTEETYHDMLIQLVEEPFNGSMSREAIEQTFVSEVKKLFGDEFKIRIEWLDELPPDRTGKMRCFVCKV